MVILERLGLEALLDQYVLTRDRRNAVTHAQALGVLLRSIVVEREPIYRQLEPAVGATSPAPQRRSRYFVRGS